MGIFVANAAIQPRKRFNRGLLLSNSAVILAGIAFFAFAIPFFRGKMAIIALDENRYIKMEWNLLQELKLQTDRKLLEKDREIAGLRERYAELASGQASGSALRDLENQLKAAEKERQELAAKPRSAEAAETPQVGLPLEESADILPAASMNTLLLDLIDEQNAELAALRARSDAQESQLAAFRFPGAAQGPETAELSAKVARNIAEAGSALELLKRKKAEADASDGMQMDDLNTWALLRALASSQSIKEKYPDLLASVEKYVDAYGRQRLTEGKREAYAASVQTLEGLVRGMKGK